MDDMTRITNTGPWERTPLDPATRELSDAQWAAREAQRALEDGRYRLAESLVGLARRAQAAEDAAATRSVPYDDPAARVAYVTRDSVLSERSRVVPVIGSTRAERPAAHGEHMSHAPNLCGHQGEDRTACQQPIGWAAGSIGFDGAAPTRAGWYHLDPEITEHEAWPQRNPL